MVVLIDLCWSKIILVCLGWSQLIFVNFGESWMILVHIGWYVLILVDFVWFGSILIALCLSQRILSWLLGRAVHETLAKCIHHMEWGPRWTFHNSCELSQRWIKVNQIVLPGIVFHGALNELLWAIWGTPGPSCQMLFIHVGPYMPTPPYK